MSAGLPWLVALTTSVAILLFLIGLLCLLTQRNVIKQVIGLKIMLQGATLGLIHAGHVTGDVRFAENGEWAQARQLLVQYRGISGNDVEQFKKPGTQVIIYPPRYKSGEMVVPFEAARR